jgi:hypothetical protein
MSDPLMVMVLCRQSAELQVRAREKLAQPFSDQIPRIISYRFKKPGGERCH